MMNTLDILLNGILAYGFALTGWALWLEVSDFLDSNLNATPTMKMAPPVVPDRRISPLKKTA